jgi:hypothetical protein
MKFEKTRWNIHKDRFLQAHIMVNNPNTDLCASCRTKTLANALFRIQFPGKSPEYQIARCCSDECFEKELKWVMSALVEKITE